MQTTAEKQVLWANPGADFTVQMSTANQTSNADLPELKSTETVNNFEAYRKALESEVATPSPDDNDNIVIRDSSIKILPSQSAKCI